MRQRPVLPDKAQLSALLMPIARRMPAYLKFGWAVATEPTIPLIHRSGLYATLIYVFTPAHVVISAIPVLGQIDLVLLLFLSLRQALKHCPEETMVKLCARVKLQPDQLPKDMEIIAHLADLGGQAFCFSVSDRAPVVAHAGRSAAFAGRVANGFTRRVAKRMRHAAQSS